MRTLHEIANDLASEHHWPDRPEGESYRLCQPCSERGSGRAGVSWPCPYLGETLLRYQRILHEAASARNAPGLKRLNDAWGALPSNSPFGSALKLLREMFE